MNFFRKAIFTVILISLTGISIFAGGPSARKTAAIAAVKKRIVRNIVKKNHTQKSKSQSIKVVEQIPLEICPIIYHPSYNVTLWGLEKLHPFDAAKYGKVHQHIKDHIPHERVRLYTPSKATDAQLRLVHSQDFLESLQNPKAVARITEIPFVSLLPNFLVQSKFLNPMKYATGGTIIGAEKALQYGCAINIGGGFHHAKPESGEGFCVYADIPIAIKSLWKKYPKLKVMVVDLDAHQGNGHEVALKDHVLLKSEIGRKNKKRVAIFDIYNGYIYPGDKEAKKYITFDFPVKRGITDDHYLGILQDELPKAIQIFKPDLIIYNAGTDIYKEDPLGFMSISAEGIIARDQFVVSHARAHNIPLLMVLSGGYTRKSADIISRSIETIIMGKASDSNKKK
ncbi:MAG TPA: histone deacetylase [Candidatus Babeliales bacterium]|nr:histone deacetylase [Candidatus Babeliales bacterium]